MLEKAIVILSLTYNVHECPRITHKYFTQISQIMAARRLCHYPDFTDYGCAKAICEIAALAAEIYRNPCDPCNLCEILMIQVTLVRF